MPSYRALFCGLLLAAGCVSRSQPSSERPAGTGVEPVVGPGRKPSKPNDEGLSKAAGERVVLTAPAAAQIRKFMAEDPRMECLYVSLSEGGDQKLDLAAELDPRDVIFGESRGVRVAVDRKAAERLPAGMILDFFEEGETKGFRFASPGARGKPDTTVTLADARRGFRTTLRAKGSRAERPPVPEPPQGVFRLVRYDAPPGPLAAYLTPDPKDGKKHPAIVWITGGDCNTIDAGCWRDGSSQSASEYRKAGVVMMFPSLRGGNDNPGDKEGYFGEVDDVLAAAAYLRTLPYVDPARVYLGGHSSGGTLALLTAECSDAFRAVFAVGPIDDMLGYGVGDLPCTLDDPRELRLRSPVQWLHSVRSPLLQGVLKRAGGFGYACRA